MMQSCIPIAVEALPLRHRAALGLCHITPSPMHRKCTSLIMTQSKTHTSIPSAALETGHLSVQRGSVVAAAAVAETHRRRRRHTEPKEQQHIDTASTSSSSITSTNCQAGECVLLYIPVKCEAQALELCRQAGYKLTNLQDHQQQLLPDVAANAQKPQTESAPSRSHTTPQHAEPHADQATVIGKTTAMAAQQQQQPQKQRQHQPNVYLQTPLLPEQQQFTRQQAHQRQHSEEAGSAQGSQSAVQPGAATQPTVETPATVEATALRAAWQIAVDSRVRAAAQASSRTISMARHTKWRGITPRHLAAPPHMTPQTAPLHSSSGRQLSDHFLPQLQQGSSSSSSVAAFEQKYGSGQQLSPAAEAKLCGMYQRYLALDQLMKEELDRHQQQQQQQQEQASSAPVASSKLGSATDIEVQGLMAQELLLELYRPLIYKRAGAAARRAPRADYGELVASARRAVLQAASKFDAARAADNNARLATLADMYVRSALKAVLQEYQAGVLSLPAHILELRRKLQQIEDKHQRLHHSKPSFQELAAAAGVSELRVKRALAATALQASGLFDLGGGNDADEQQGSGLNLQLLDTTDSFEELDSLVAQGAIKASRSGLQEEQEHAAEAELLASVMQQYLMALSERDRSLLTLRIGIRLPEKIHSKIDKTAGEQCVTSSISDGQQQGSAGVRVASGGSHVDAVQLQDVVVCEQGMSLDELAKHFNFKSRQRAHQLMEGAVRQLRQQLQQAAEQDDKVAQLLAGSKLVQ